MKKIKFTKKMHLCSEDDAVLCEVLDKFLNKVPRCELQFWPFVNNNYYSILVLSSLFRVIYDGVIWRFYITDNHDSTYSFVWTHDESNNGWIGTFNEMIECIIGIRDV